MTGNSDNMITAKSLTKSLGNIQPTRQNGSSYILTKKNPVHIVEKELDHTISSIGNGNSDYMPRKKEYSLTVTP
jgi:hypothetical protein